MSLAPRTPWLTLYPGHVALHLPQLHLFHLNQSSTPSNSNLPPQVLISPPCQLSNLPAPPCKPCCPAPPFKWSPFHFSKPLFSVTCPPVLLVLWYQRFSGKICSFLYTGFLTLVYEHPGDFYHHGLCGLGCPGTWASGLKPVSGVRGVKFRLM